MKLRYVVITFLQHCHISLPFFGIPRFALSALRLPGCDASRFPASVTPLSSQAHKMSFAAANKRLLKEYKALLRESPEGIVAGPIDESNLFEWECLIQGPDETPFEGGVFPATLSFPKVSTF